MNLIEKQKDAIFEGLHCRSSSKDKNKVSIDAFA